MSKKKQKAGKIAGFISKLVEILKNKQNEEIVFYNQRERSFTIKNVRKFTEEILPRYFKHKNYSSFVRQVNLYNFHKFRHEGKQEEYRHEFFDILSTKELKKIKRKPMVSQKSKNHKRNQNKSDFSDSDEDQIDDESIDYESENNKNSSSKSNVKRQELGMQLKELERRKLSLQNQIRQEQLSNEKLQSENMRLRTTLNTQHLQFYTELLKILQNLLISQFNQGSVKPQIYDKIVRYIYLERETLNDSEKESQTGKPKCLKESKFMTLVKESLTVKRTILTIPYFIQRMLNFIETEESSSSCQPNQNDIRADPLFMNYDPYFISSRNSKESNSQKKFMEEQKKETSEKIVLSSEEQIKSQSKKSSKIQKRKETSLKDLRDRKRIKKQKKIENSSKDEEYLPKNHR